MSVVHSCELVFVCIWSLLINFIYLTTHLFIWAEVRMYPKPLRWIPGFPTIRSDVF